MNLRVVLKFQVSSLYSLTKGMNSSPPPQKINVQKIQTVMVKIALGGNQYGERSSDQIICCLVGLASLSKGQKGVTSTCPVQKKPASQCTIFLYIPMKHNCGVEGSGHELNKMKSISYTNYGIEVVLIFI